MPKSFGKKNKLETIKITEPLTVQYVSNHSTHILHVLESDKDGISLELEDVEDCDTAGVQFIVSISKTAQNMNKTFTVPKPSQPVLDAFKRVGVTEIDNLMTT